MKTHIFRLTPGKDLYKELQNYIQKNNISAAIVLTCVGSLKAATLRMAGASKPTSRKGAFEIVSLSGTLCPDGVHLHASLSDSEGKVWGGHLVPGSSVFTTAEIALGEMDEFHFSRKLDPKTGFLELSIKKKPDQ